MIEILYTRLTLKTKEKNNTIKQTHLSPRNYMGQQILHYSTQHRRVESFSKQKKEKKKKKVKI